MACDVCADCLRRSELVAHLAPRIAALLDRPDRRVPGLLALSEHDLIEAVAGSSAPAARRFLERFDRRAAIARLDAARVEALCGHAEAYPASLHRLADPPVALYCTGGTDRLAELIAMPAVTVVGSRHASPYALEVAYELGRCLGAARVAVVSGLALGVDAAVHRGVLDGGGEPLAVLACGPDVAYPRRHRGLHERVRERGAVIAELPPGTRPFRWSFPARNRIMAGLANLTVIVEAAEASGSLITAAFAEQIGADVGVVPGRVTSLRSVGSNRLLRDGAQVVLGAEDVLEALFGLGRVPMPEPDGGAARPGGSGESRSGCERERTSPHRGAPTVAAASTTELEPHELRVLDAVEALEAGADAIGRETGLPAGVVRAALGRLEAAGMLTRDALGSYERTARDVSDRRTMLDRGGLP